LLSLRRPTTSSDHTSSNSSPRTSNSLFLIVSPRLLARSSLPPSDHQLSIERLCGVLGLGWNHMGLHCIRVVF
jgi:hypothetical protein